MGMNRDEKPDRAFDHANASARAREKTQRHIEHGLHPMRRSRVVVILELRHEDNLSIPHLREALIRAVKNEAMPYQKGSISVGVSYDNMPE